MKIAVAMSGGVDSAVTAKRLLEEGHEVIGVSMRLLPISDEIFEENFLAPLRVVSEFLGIEINILDLRSEFKELVLKRSWENYDSAHTPNPCAYCNQRLKFGALWEFAKSLSCDKIATGHYAQVIEKEGVYTLQRGLDSNKDQTYFLLELSQAQLSHVLMPLGAFTKTQVREFAANYALPNAKKAESQDTCFATGDTHFSEMLRLQFDGKIKKGHFISPNGKTLGHHEGIHLYTIGQRKGLKIALGKPAYVTCIDPKNYNVTLSTEDDDLLKDHFYIRTPNWQSGKAPLFPLHCQVQIRYRSRPVKCTVMPADEGVLVTFETPERAVTQGQCAALYDQMILLGGGDISL